MAVSLPQAPAGSLVPEYAATSINFNRTVQHTADGITAVFTANIAYALTTYLVDDKGKKTGIVAPATTQPMQPAPDTQNNYGNIFVSSEQLAAIAAQPSTPGVSTFDAIANLADELIKADLIARKIITA